MKKKYEKPTLKKEDLVAVSTFGLKTNGSCTMCQLTNYH